MEDALGDDKIFNQILIDYSVLILVLMEDALGGFITLPSGKTAMVLILVLMEDALGEEEQQAPKFGIKTS